jgi:hypothetical protein
MPVRITPTQSCLYELLLQRIKRIQFVCVGWIKLAQYRVQWTCEQGYQPSGFIKGGDFAKRLSGYFLKEDSMELEIPGNSCIGVCQLMLILIPLRDVSSFKILVH